MSTLVPTEAQIAAFEQETLSFFHRAASRDVLSGEQIIAGLLLRLTQQNDALYQAITGRSGLAPSPAEAVQALVAVTFSLDPSSLNGILVATPAVDAYVAAAPVQFPTLVPANGTAEITIPPPSSYALGSVGPVSLSSTEVGAEVSVVATLDGKSLVGPQGFILGPTAQLRGPSDTYATAEGLVVKFTNPSASDVTVWFFGEMLTIAQSFYEKFILGVGSAAYQAISSAYGLRLS